MTLWQDIQRHVGVDPDGKPGDETARAVAKALGIGAAPNEITPNVAAELVGHEAIVREAYKDSAGIWTWGIGVTSASGHSVERYKDNPQTIQKCLEIFIWLLHEKYAPAVVKAFGCPLTEAQFAAALSFHYNTGAILTADWVKLWKQGDLAKAETAIMNWRSPPEIIPRREAERDLFFDGKWSFKGAATVWPVKKPSYTPDWAHPSKVAIMEDLEGMLG